MKLFGITIGDTKKTKDGELPKQKLNLRKELSHDLAIFSKYEAFVIILLVVGLLSVTTLRMLRYTNPPTDPNRLSENLQKIQKITIDPKVIDSIKQLTDSQATASPNISTTRNNPFSELPQ